MSQEVEQVFADGGVVLKNPSPHGGTWAFVHVGMDEKEVCRASGMVLPAETGTATVSNGQTEFLAVLMALERLEDGWSGDVLTDSLVTIQRFTGRGTSLNLPDAWWQRMAVCLGRLGRLRFILLDGHPSREQLRNGVGKRGNRVSRWNVLCDGMCKELAVEFLRRAADGQNGNLPNDVR